MKSLLVTVIFSALALESFARSIADLCEFDADWMKVKIELN